MFILALEIVIVLVLGNKRITKYMFNSNVVDNNQMGTLTLQVMRVKTEKLSILRHEDFTKTGRTTKTKSVKLTITIERQ